MSRGKTTYSPYEFSRAAWEEVCESERSWRVKWAIAFLPTSQRGVWKMSIQVIDLARGTDPVPVVRHEAEWPNSRAQAFEAFCYSTAHCVARMVEEWGAQWAAEQARARA